MRGGGFFSDQNPHIPETSLAQMFPQTSFTFLSLSPFSFPCFAFSVLVPSVAFWASRFLASYTPSETPFLLGNG